MWAVEKGDVIGARRAAAERGKDSQGNDGEPRYGSDVRMLVGRRQQRFDLDQIARKDSLRVPVSGQFPLPGAVREAGVKHLSSRKRSHRF